MARRFYNLPPLTTLAAFEAAGRHLSFKNAAQELSVTPGAISHQVKALETELGTPLFLRKHRGVELSSEGERLFETLASAFSRISSDLDHLRDLATGDTVTVGSTSAVAALWLSPAVNRFWRGHPDVNVRQVTQDRGPWSHAEPDLRIRYGAKAPLNRPHTELFWDTLAPVAAPSVADDLQGADLATLAAQRLIHLDSEDQTWTSWRDWFRELGYTGPIARGIHVNNYAIALQAAQDGVGLALGWRRLVAPVLRTKALTVIAPHATPALHSFYLISKSEQDLSDAAKALRDWIVATVDDTSRTSPGKGPSVEVNSS